MDKVYYISRCQLKTANKQFTHLKNDYEMTFNADTVVAECMEDVASVPSIKYDFVPINEIANKSPDTLLGMYILIIGLYILIIFYIIYFLYQKTMRQIY